jgi:PAS domain S-box-containing protein
MDGYWTAPKITDEEFYHLCYEFSTDIIYLLDRDMIIERVSPSIRRVLGYDPSECVGKAFAAFNRCSEDDVSRINLDFRSLLMGMRIVDGEYTCITSAGRERVFEVNGHPLFDHGMIRGAIISARDITHEKGYERDLQEILGNLRKSLDVTIKTITRTIDFKDPYTAGHQQRVSDLARAIATEMDLNFDTINGIRMAGIVHDIGKISIPSEILSKPGRLHMAERELIKIHPIIGFDILSSIDFPWPVAAAVLQHHERMDGSGYPYGITGDYILLDAKIIGVADVVEALATHRPYRASIGVTEALAEVEQKAGHNYDQDVVNACLRLFREKDYQFLV